MGKMEIPVALFTLLVLCARSVAESDNSPLTPILETTTVNKAVNLPTKPHNSSVSHNVTEKGDVIHSLNVDSSMIRRALYVLMGITVIGVLYFIARAVRLKKTSQRKKYGLLSNYDENVEMAPLESDEEDTTVYEAKTLRR
ncbi:protein FAM174C [Amia ocellicauda]|uniref:protein FAM174C n=1 Tax=Amia ocellicauda TaxID=2972642 RepID=UPI003463F45E